MVQIIIIFAMAFITLTMDTLANLNTSGSIATGAGFQVYFGLRLGTSSQTSSTINAKATIYI